MCVWSQHCFTGQLQSREWEAQTTLPPHLLQPSSHLIQPRKCQMLQSRETFLKKSHLWHTNIGALSTFFSIWALKFRTFVKFLGFPFQCRWFTYGLKYALSQLWDCGHRLLGSFTTTHPLKTAGTDSSAGQYLSATSMHTLCHQRVIPNPCKPTCSCPNCTTRQIKTLYPALLSTDNLYC